MVEDPASVDELVTRARGGDRHAYRQLVERYQRRVFAIAFEIVRNREDAEDIVQESFVKAFLSLRDFRGQASFYTWLYRIAYNMAIDFRRKIARRGGAVRERTPGAENGQAESALEAVGGASASPHEVLHRKEQARRIQEVLDGISEEHRAVIILREIEGMNYDEIARTVGISKGTVMSRLHYARKKLQEGLKDLAPLSSISNVESGADGDETPAAAMLKAR